MTLYLKGHSFAYELECVARIFYPGEKIAVARETLPGAGEAAFLAAWAEPVSPGKVQLGAKVCLGAFRGQESCELERPEEQEVERRLCELLFLLLCRQAGRRPPWGILTGVRPVRLCGRLLEQGNTEDEVRRILTGRYLATPEKAELALRTHQLEARVLEKKQRRGFSLYIGVPFCPTRCLYCSFVSHAIDKAARLVPDYVKCLAKELEATGRLARELNLTLQTVYMGGGTPTALAAADLDLLLGTVRRSFDVSHLLEYTVEAGRPDTITPEKLAVLRRHGADRISINPQTMDDDILREIGRRHTAAQVLEGFQMAREAGFGVVNMDLIAGLPGEDGTSFARSLGQVLDLEPENITLHTLTVKRSSDLRGRDGAYDAGNLEVGALLDDAYRRLDGAGYSPYYLYRQKGTVENLENVGFSRPGAEGIYNVLMMEDIHTVLAAGAGAVTKLWEPGGELERVFNFKYPYEYIGRFGEVLSRKAPVKEFYERYY